MLILIDMDNKNEKAFLELSAIREHKFILNLADYKAGQHINISYGFDVLPMVGKEKLAIAVGVKYEHDGKLILECWYLFDFFVRGGAKDFTIYDGETVKLPENFLPGFLRDAFCTLRGIILTKTQGINEMPILPLIDVNRIIAAKFPKGASPKPE